MEAFDTSIIVRMTLYGRRFIPEFCNVPSNRLASVLASHVAVNHLWLTIGLEPFNYDDVGEFLWSSLDPVVRMRLRDAFLGHNGCQINPLTIHQLMYVMSVARTPPVHPTLHEVGPLRCHGCWVGFSMTSLTGAVRSGD